MCFDLFPKVRSQNLPISGPIVKAKVKEIAQKRGYFAFTVSGGWLQKWLKRRNIAVKHIADKVSDINQVDVVQLKAKLPSGYPPEHIYNADES
ncbi:Tc5 transposase DNA-binding domain [Popillia japonica]|uniref:Tc5 transposase DNA-binding domain n=1 Tax=Popillia japonica TaxID=7064 RepID=A0AAW1L3W3_POPJA